MRKQFLIVELRKPEQLQRAQAEVKRLRDEIAALQSRITDLEVRYGFELYLNNELCDLCRAAGVPFRPALERARGRSDRR